MEVSNAERVVFPRDGITKGEVVGYYEAVSARMMPFVAERALTVERYPKGTGEKGFMQKNAPSHFSDDLIERHTVPREEGGTTTYPVVHTADAIAAFANLGVITFHVPPSTVDDVERHDWAIWDLDPPPGRHDLVRESAKSMRDVLSGFGIPTVVMTSGSNGYHLRVRLKPTADVGTAATITRGTSALAAAANPDLMTLEFLKKNRGDRVFVDWLRNAPYSTSVVPWSLRARDGAPIAAPIGWDEIDEISPDGVRLADIEERFEDDPWKGQERLDFGPVAERVAGALDDSGIVLEPFDRFRG